MQQFSPDLTQFHALDQAAQPRSFVQFMDTSHAQATAQSYKQAILEQLAPRAGSVLLDVGCGTGQDTLELCRGTIQGRPDVFPRSHSAHHYRLGHPSTRSPFPLRVHNPLLKPCLTSHGISMPLEQEIRVIC